MRKEIREIYEIAFQIRNMAEIDHKTLLLLKINKLILKLKCLTKNEEE